MKINLSALRLPVSYEPQISLELVQSARLISLARSYGDSCIAVDSSRLFLEQCVDKPGSDVVRARRSLGQSLVKQMRIIDDLTELVHTIDGAINLWRDDCGGTRHVQ